MPGIPWRPHPVRWRVSKWNFINFSPEIILIVFRAYFSSKTIPELIRYCLDINCNIKDDGILPKCLCQLCFEKLKIAFELKTKSKESDNYLKEILLNQSSEVDTEEPMMQAYVPETSSYYTGLEEQEESLLEPLNNDNDDDDDDYRDVSKPFRKGERSGAFECSVCNRSFRYVKPFKNHMKQHALAEQANLKKSQRNRKPSARLAPAPAANKQAPYDSRSPYESPARFDASPAVSPARESSPDFGMMVTAHNLLAGEAATKKSLRTRKQRLPSRSPSHEPSPEIIEQPSRKGRGRPKKKSRLEDEVQEIDDDESESESAHSFIEGFKEVDLSSVLKSKTFGISADDSQSAPSTTRSRSRSASLELIQEFDIFGGPPPSDNGQTKRPTMRPSMSNFESGKRPTMSSFGSGTTFPCDIRGCNKKFHLRANLKKHLRETHGRK